MISLKFSLILSLLTLLLFQAGVFFVTWQVRQYLKVHKGYLFWLVGILSSFFAYLLILLEAISTGQLSKLTLLSTGAAICFALSQVMQVLFLLNLTKEWDPKKKTYLTYFSLFVLCVYALFFEYARNFPDFIFRGTLTSIAYLISDVLSLYLLWRLRQSKDPSWSKQLYFPAVAIFGNFLTSIFRVIFLLYPDVLGLNPDAQLSIGLFILMQVFSTLTFVGISYYWVEELGITNRKLMAESKEVKALMAVKERTLNQLLLSQKSTMLGAYAHLVAHEVNQPLATLQINADFLKELLSPKTDLVRERGLVDSMIVEILRAATIIRSIKGLLTQDKNGPSFFSLDALATDVAQTQRKKMLENNIELNMSLNTAKFIFADKNELQLVLMNLFENAIFAIASSAKGKSSNILKGASNALHFQSQIKLITCFEGKNVVIKLMDNGPGVNPEYRNNLFELHNTSKEGGTGMGLWLSSFIAKRHHGTLTYDDSYLEGASFSLIFPCVHQQVDE